MSDENRLVAAVRTEFGKGAARRARRDGQVPAVLYGHGTDPKHLALPAREFAAVLRAHGTNALLTLEVDGGEELALTKSVVVHPIRNYIEHADLLVVKKGEKVTVEVPLVVTGEAASGTLVVNEVSTVQLEADALNLPEQVEVSIEGVEAGTQILANNVQLPAGATLQGDPELLLVNVVAAPTAAAMEGETAEGEAAEAEEA
ncbi:MULTISPECIES: 50S ribosomal protein L25/general stress protein Ctc [Rhodococcus]|jgi:large subunit ribosomal protein L25|uniref:Large ribosomal subunit protein bL25 n=1 Tax=Rhodococcus aetherivorans TaxID=191292 RepID=A0A059MVX9_9NOCA|nr:MULTISPECIES: 50S ribosomal protein L25/general stress protein Ctc [Rhodococcus]ETT25460.1 50S ribosomal protein L25 [Rhodococcus rhodochrous ATCC 21198]NCL74179.1 50S ribosomal protein L25 [Rhodococcus sp. YH1]AKE89069.1 50S ribosomal protein L25 [Rhodococcus aetherivorans]ANZ26236.1 50S ribosomal protein L25/general stress protein Ctc [Rhodococcus sp. WB1]KDE15305.1 50S ribosomal protein L25 [Rhodococcus aetherivorans]